jgi:phage shock protein A
LVGQLDALIEDIKQARETDSQIKRDIIQAEQMIGTLTSRHQSLKVRRQMQTELSQICDSVSEGANQLEMPLANQVKQLESEMEAANLNKESWEQEWQELRNRRALSDHQAQLDEIKKSLGRKNQKQITSKSTFAMGGQ